MNVTCPDCRTVYRVDPIKIPAGGVRARCARCPAEFPVAELAEVGAVYSAASDVLGSGVVPIGADIDPPDTFADSFDGIEESDDSTVPGITDEASGAWGAMSDNGWAAETADAGAEEDSSESWRAESQPDEYPSEEGNQSEDFVAAVEPTGETAGSDDAFRAEDASEISEVMTAEFESDAYVEGTEAPSAMDDSDHGYDRNGIRHDSVSASPVAEDALLGTEEAQGEEPGSFESSFDDDGGRPEAAVSDAHEAEPDRDESGHGIEAPEVHADAVGALDQGDSQESTAATDAASPAGETDAEFSDAAEFSDDVGHAEPVHADAPETEYAASPAVEAHATSEGDADQVSAAPTEDDQLTPAAEAPPAPEMLESIRTPEGFSEVERQIPDADTPLPPAPFGSADPHTRAKRLARALVSDMVVYNTDRRERSIRQGTVRQEFREEIRKSWDEYVSHVGNQIARDTPYFRDALNELLAGGNDLF